MDYLRKLFGLIKINNTDQQESPAINSDQLYQQALDDKTNGNFEEYLINMYKAADMSNIDAIKYIKDISDIQHNMNFSKYINDLIKYESTNGYISYLIGKIYYYGKGTNIDYNETIKYYKLAADKGYGRAAYRIGDLYYCGKYIYINNTEAIKYFKLAAKLNDSNAFYKLGSIYYYGRNNIKVNYWKSYKYYMNAIKYDQTHIDYQNALTNIGYMYYKGQPERNMDICYDTAIYYLKQAADLDNIIAIHLLGYIYCDSKNPNKNYERSIHYFKMSVAKGSSDSMYILGLIYYNGECGVEQNTNEATRYFKMGAEHGDTDSMFRLGCMYYNGEGVKLNIQLALNYFKMAADKGHDGAMCNVGCIYHYGFIEEGVNINYDDAIKYYKMAITKNEKCAMYNLATMYETGIGVDKDIKKAVDYYQMTNNNAAQDKINTLDPHGYIREILAQQKTIQQLENEILDLKYKPDGPGYIEAKNHFMSMSQN